MFRKFDHYNYFFAKFHYLYILSYDDEKKRYEALKIELYEKYKNDRKQYTLGKDKYIKEIINKAINEDGNL